MIKKTIILSVFFILLTNYTYALEGLSFSTFLNKPDSIGNRAQYRVNDALTWNFRLKNTGSSFNTNVCFYLEAPNNVIYDITDFILSKANMQYYNCDMRTADCPIKLNNIGIGVIQQEITGNVLTYAFSDDLPRGRYKLIAQLREPNVLCSNPDTGIIPIAKYENYLEYLTEIIPNCPPEGSGNPPFTGCRTSNPTNSDLRTEYTCSQGQQCYQCWAGYVWDGSNCVRKYYFVFVPIPPEWGSDQQFFEQKARDRAVFFKDISKFKDRLVEFIYVNISYVNSNCDLANFRLNTLDFSNHQKIKDCADRYTRSLGVSYERAVGFSNTFNSGYAFFRYKMAWTSRGFNNQDYPALGVHELSHTYNLCEEYCYYEYNRINNNFGGNFCKNKYPTQCPKDLDQNICTNPSRSCLGNTPTFRDYSGNPPIQGVCEGSIHYSVMGTSSFSMCGYDATGGYEAVG